MFTWTALADAGAWRIWNRAPPVAGSRPIDTWEQRTGDDLIIGDLVTQCSRIAASYERAFHTIDDATKRGMLLLFFYLKNDPAIPDVRMKAYLLATVKHDCAGTFWPTRRGVRGQRKYVSRGYVQLSGEDNYRAASQAIFSDDRLVSDPEQAMQPDIAYAIMSSTMLHGFVTPQRRRRTTTLVVGPKLSDFIHDQTADYVGARDVVKKGDRDANLIAGYARHFETWLRGP
jgi:putative chitinase